MNISFTIEGWFVYSLIIGLVLILIYIWWCIKNDWGHKL